MLNASAGGRQRPVSITILAGLCLLTAVAIAVVLAVWLVNPAALQALIDIEIPSSPPVSKIAIALVYAAVCVACGVGLLKGASWSRPLTLAVTLLGFFQATDMSTTDLIGEAVWLLLMLWLLFRSKADRWFKSRPNGQPANAV